MPQDEEFVLFSSDCGTKLGVPTRFLFALIDQLAARFDNEECRQDMLVALAVIKGPDVPATAVAACEWPELTLNELALQTGRELCAVTQARDVFFVRVRGERISSLCCYCRIQNEIVKAISSLSSLPAPGQPEGFDPSLN